MTWQGPGAGEDGTGDWVWIPGYFARCWLPGCAEEGSSLKLGCWSGWESSSLRRRSAGSRGSAPGGAARRGTGRGPAGAPAVRPRWHLQVQAMQGTAFPVRVRVHAGPGLVVASTPHWAACRMKSARRAALVQALRLHVLRLQVRPGLPGSPLPGGSTENTVGWTPQELQHGDADADAAQLDGASRPVRADQIPWWSRGLRDRPGTGSGSPGLTRRHPGVRRGRGSGRGCAAAPGKKQLPPPLGLSPGCPCHPLLSSRTPRLHPALIFLSFLLFFLSGCHQWKKKLLYSWCHSLPYLKNLSTINPLFVHSSCGGNFREVSHTKSAKKRKDCSAKNLVQQAQIFSTFGSMTIRLCYSFAFVLLCMDKFRSFLICFIQQIRNFCKKRKVIRTPHFTSPLSDSSAQLDPNCFFFVPSLPSVCELQVLNVTAECAGKVRAQVPVDQQIITCLHEAVAEIPLACLVFCFLWRRLVFAITYELTFPCICAGIGLAGM